MSRNGTDSQYAIELVRKSDGAKFGRRGVPDANHESAREQYIFFGQRRGALASDVTHVHVFDLPVFFDAATGEIKGVEMSLGDEIHADLPSMFFGTGLFQSFGQRVAAELIQAKQIAASDDIRIHVFANDNFEQVMSTNGSASILREPLPLLEGDIESLLSQSVAIGPDSAGDYPVFVTEAALDRAREFVWQRNSERGVWLIGNLYRQRRPHEIFGVVHTVFEARGTKHERFSLDFSTETFTHVQQQLQLSRTRFKRPADLVMGFYHSHPFLPSILDGMEACPTCSLRPTCKLTSSFFSSRDQTFHAAMFASAPYAVEIVLGLTPREEFDLKMFCCDGGQFRERGYYRLAEAPAAALSNGELVR